MFSETHFHLRHLPYDFVGPTIKTAEKAGVELALDTGVDVDSSEQEIITARRYDILKASIGIHPWNADLCTEKAIQRLKELSANEEVVAFSEIGLDYRSRRERETARSGAEPLDKQIQRNAFRELLRAAKELKLPVIIHDNTPDQEVLDILKEEGNAQIGAIIHGFNKDPAYAKRCVEMGIFISIGLGILESGSPINTSIQPMRVTIPWLGIEPQQRAPSPEREKQRTNLIEVIKQTDMKWILTETDRQNPAGVLIVAKKIAEIKDLTTDKVGRMTTQNLKKLLRI